jgi:hypothetical protein
MPCRESYGKGKPVENPFVENDYYGTQDDPGTAWTTVNITWCSEGLSENNSRNVEKALYSVPIFNRCTHRGTYVDDNLS